MRFLKRAKKERLLTPGFHRAMRPVSSFCLLGLLVSPTGAKDERSHARRRQDTTNRNWRSNNNFIVLGDSTSDTGRRFDAPASFDFEDIGPYPWTRLFEDPDSDKKVRAYLPGRGTLSNGKVWADWLGIPEEHNFATSGASASATFRNQETCYGYTGQGEDYPTGTLEEQVTRYFHEVVDHTNETLGYTHVIIFGTNDLNQAAHALQRYGLGGPGYVDPIPFDKVFTMIGGQPQPTFGPVENEIVAALAQGVSRLIERGVTGRIMISTMPSFRAVPEAVASGLAYVFDQTVLAVRASMRSIIATNPQLRELDLYGLFAAVVDTPEVFTNKGFSKGTGAELSSPCLTQNFEVDSAAEIMGTQELRHEDCRGTCALCADNTTPCQTCLEGKPSVTVCEDAGTRIFWDSTHVTRRFHKHLAKVVRYCAEDSPKAKRSWVDIVCPTETT